MKERFRILLSLIILIAVIIVSGCSSSSDDENEITITNEEAQNAMVSTLYSGFNANLESMDTGVIDSGVLDTLVQNPQVSSMLDESTVTTLTTAESMSDFIDINTLIGEESGYDDEINLLIPDDETAEEYAAQIDLLIEKYFNEPVRIGNTITYTLNPDVCDDEETAEEIAQCTNMLSLISIEQVLTSDTSGTVNLIIDGNNPLTLGYNTTEVYVEIDLGITKTVLELMAPMLDSDDESLQLPEIFSGAVRLTLATPDESTASVKLGVTQAIDIDGMLDDEMIDISLANSPDLVVLTATETAIDLSVSMGAMSINMNNPLDESETPGIVQVSMGGLSLNSSLNELGNIIISDSGITDSLSIQLGPTEDELFEFLNVTLADFDATFSLEDFVLAFDSDFDFDLTVMDPQGMLSDLVGDGIDLTIASELSIEATAGTDVTLITSAEDGSMALNVISGDLTISGTEALAGSVSATTDQCLGQATSSEGFPIEVISCPATP